MISLQQHSTNKPINLFIRSTILCLLLCLSASSFAQELLVPYRDGTQWGFADTSGKLRIQPAWDKVDFFNSSTNTTEVFRNKKISVIDKQGKQLFPFSDSYYRFGNTYIITQENKKGMYSLQGTELLPAEYNSIECTCAYNQYRKDTGKVIAQKNNTYFLVSMSTAARKEIPKPYRPPLTGTVEGITPVPYDPDDLVSVPNPQLQSTDFPMLAGAKNLVHCKTLYLGQKPVFYIFCAWQDRIRLGYVGQNGVRFYKD